MNFFFFGTTINLSFKFTQYNIPLPSKLSWELLIKRKIECQRHMVVVKNRQISNLFLVPFCFSLYNFQSNTYHLIKPMTWEQHKQLYLYKCKLKKSNRPDKNSTQHPYSAKSNIIKTQLSIQLVYAKFSLLINMSQIYCSMCVFISKLNSEEILISEIGV